jgi:hypothetical protein
MQSAEKTRLAGYHYCMTLVTAEEGGRIANCEPRRISLCLDPVAVMLSSDRQRKLPLYNLADVERLKTDRARRNLDNLPVYLTVTGVAKSVRRSAGRVLNDLLPQAEYLRAGKMYPLFTQQNVVNYIHEERTARESLDEGAED